MELSQDQPLISVYIPTHNRCELLKRAIQSVMAQSHQNFELLVVNDGSKDDTREFLNSLSKADPRVRAFHNYPAGGACKARNTAISNAAGEYITGLDDDDEFLPNRLESLINAMKDEYSFVTSSLYWDYGDCRKVLGNIEVDIELEDVLSHKYATPQVLTKTSYLKEAGMFDENFPTNQDWDAWTRLIVTKGHGRKINQPTYVIHTAHDSPRISISNKKVEGFKMFINKYEHLMSSKNKRDMKVLLTIKEGGSLGFFNACRELSARTFPDYMKYWLRDSFPGLATLYTTLRSR